MICVFVFCSRGGGVKSPGPPVGSGDISFSCGRRTKAQKSRVRCAGVQGLELRSAEPTTSAPTSHRTSGDWDGDLGDLRCSTWRFGLCAYIWNHGLRKKMSRWFWMKAVPSNSEMSEMFWNVCSYHLFSRFIFPSIYFMYGYIYIYIYIYIYNVSIYIYM